MSNWAAGHCANCDLRLNARSAGLIYCSDRCRSYAKDVRYFRRCYRDSRQGDPDVKKALQTRMAFLVADGYDRRSRSLAGEVREEILSANGRLCLICNEAPATQVDHIAGSGNERENLQGLCEPCHIAKTQAELQPMGPAETAQRDTFLNLVTAESPHRLCHDETDWERVEPTLRAEAREWRKLIAGDDEAGYWGDGASGTAEDVEHGLYLMMLAERDD